MRYLFNCVSTLKTGNLYIRNMIRKYIQIKQIKKYIQMKNTIPNTINFLNLNINLNRIIVLFSVTYAGYMYKAST